MQGPLRTRLRRPPMSEMALRWAAQLRAARSNLRRNPDSATAWRDRIQIRVFGFLLSRYGRDRTVTPFHPDAGLPAVLASGGTISRRVCSSEERRTVLRRIAEANRTKP